MNKMNSLVTYIFFLVAPFCLSGQTQWEILTIPDTIQIKCMASNSQNYIYLGTGGNNINGGIYRTIDNCISWEFLGFENHGIYSININDYNHIFIGWKGDIYKSEDNGNSWILQYDGFANVSCIKSYPNGILFANSGTGSYLSLIKSSDYGETWEEVLIFPNNIEYVTDIAILNEDTVYAGTTDWLDGGGVYRSVDGGYNWEHIGMYDFHVLALEVNSNGELFAGTYGHNTQYWLSGVYIYNELTNDWTLLANKFVNDILINQDDEIFVACDYIGAGVLYSNNNGQSFEYINEGLFEGGVDDLAIDSSGYLYASSYEPSNLARSLNPTITGLPKYLDRENDIEVRIYPNPFTSFLTFNIQSENINSPIEISLYTILGQKVKNIKTKLSQNGSTIFNFDAGNIPAGSYFYSINCNGKVYSDKVLKQ